MKGRRSRGQQKKAILAEQRANVFLEMVRLRILPFRFEKFSINCSSESLIFNSSHFFLKRSNTILGLSIKSTTLQIAVELSS